MAEVGRVLVTGMSGTGKSTVLAELARRGHRVVDLDEPRWSEEVPTADGGLEQLWDAERVDGLLAAEDDLFVGGCARNQGLFSARFDAVVLLSAPREVLLRRLATRTTNRFGQPQEERRRVLADLELVEPLLRRSTTAEVVTDAPLSDVVDAVERHAGRPRQPTHDS